MTKPSLSSISGSSKASLSISATLSSLAVPGLLSDSPLNPESVEFDNMNERNEDKTEKSGEAESDDGDIPGAPSDEQEESGQEMEDLPDS